LRMFSATGMPPIPYRRPSPGGKQRWLSGRYVL